MSMSILVLTKKNITEENVKVFVIPKINNILDSLYTLSDQDVIEKMKDIVPGYRKKLEFHNQ